MEDTLKVDLVSVPAIVSSIEQRIIEGSHVGYIIKLRYESQQKMEQLTIYLDNKPQGVEVDETIHFCLEMRS